VGALRPTLETARLRLKPLTDEDLPHLVALNGDPAVMRWITGRAQTPEEVAAELPSLLSDDRGLGFWCGYGDDGSFAGVWCLTVDRDHPEAAELGWRLPRHAWSRGLATEGATAVMGHGFATVGLARQWAETMAVNAPSRRVMEKLGMSLVRSYVGEWEHPIPGWEQGEVVYELSRPDWLTSSRRGPSLP